MQPSIRDNFKQVIAIMILLLIVSGCATTISSPVASQTNEPRSLADLTSVASIIMRYQGENSQTEVKPGETVDVQVNDRIEADENGRAILKLSDLLEVEIFRNTKVSLDELRLESGGSTFVKLNQDQGHTRVSLNIQAPVQLTLETEYATIKTLEDGTEFIVCHAPDLLTCLDVKKGSVEITAKDKTELVKAGEATYVLKDQAPKPAVCAPVEIFIEWEAQMRESADTRAVGELVAELPQQPCSAPTAETGSLPGSEGMVKINYGTYEVGSNQGNEFYSAPQDIPLDNFWIDVYEVTNAQYQIYLDDTGEQPPVIWPDKEKYPVRGVTWDQANAYCTWAKKRLPTEAEWEVAGRGPGPNARLYPWGNDPDAGGKFNELPLSEPYEVGTYSFNVSPFKVYDLAGNVWEWVGEPYASVHEGYHLLRGGRFGLIRDLAYRYPTTSDDKGLVPYAGFRCAADQVE